MNLTKRLRGVASAVREKLLLERVTNKCESLFKHKLIRRIIARLHSHRKHSQRADEAPVHPRGAFVGEPSHPVSTQRRPPKEQPPPWMTPSNRYHFAQKFQNTVRCQARAKSPALLFYARHSPGPQSGSPELSH